MAQRHLTSPLMEQVTRECVVEQEDIKRDTQLASILITIMHGETVDGCYGDGLLITYDSPRQHIWSYIVGRTDNHTDTCCNCPCAVSAGPAPPPFVGTNYYCESGAVDVYNASAYYFNDPLWDRSGCITSKCCATPTQPWFYRLLSGTTTSDIEARICTYYNFARGSPLIDQLELYIQ